MDPLSSFDPRIRAWFAARFAAPTDIQARAWPRIAAGEHLLATAPTGSGKTLTAFLWALDRLATGAWEPGAVRVLYVSPLKALNNDIGRNLLTPLRELELENVRVAVRSGDTPQSERQRMVRRPPEILVTTPESLNLLLASPRARAVLHGVRSVILDEIHAVAGSKRGTYLMTAVERLVPLCGEFQRLALSATVQPLATVAAFVGGTGRTVGVVESSDAKRLDVSVCSVPRPDVGSVWPAVVEELRARLHGNRATLFFVNNRALAEKLVRWINDAEEEPLAYAHHGSLSRELRALVERKLKDGELKALVATSSLELGIDIGGLDEVVLVQAPRTLNSAVQRVGRAGHGVGETSRGVIYPTFGRDYLDAAVLAPLVEARAGEPLRPVRAPLDVLAQVLVAMCGVAERDLDEVYALLVRSWPYRDLTRAAFDRVVAMLRGRYAGTRLRELRPRLRIDPATGRARGVAGALPLVYRSGGVIPDRGYYTLRVEGSGARLGELDEEFVWERRIGHEVAIGAQVWRIRRISRNDVVVVPGTGDRPIPPFWKAEQAPRGFELSERIGLFLEEADARLDDPEFTARLRERNCLDEGAAETLVEWLRRQKEETGAPLPHRRHLLVERYQDPEYKGEAKQVMLHAAWGDAVWRPFGIALAGAWEERYGTPLQAFSGDDGLLVHLPDEAPVDGLLDLVTPDTIESHLRRRLEQTGFFGSRFRECAGRALLLPRGGRQRVPLWLNRLRAQKLLQAVREYGDFPILAETWRTCLEDEFDLPRLRALLDEVASGAIRVTTVATRRPSPFAEGLAWRSTNFFMYDQNERAPAAGGPAVGDAVLRDVLHDASLRPSLDAALVAELEGKLQRTAEGYRPADAAEWVDLVAERILVRPWTDELPPGVVVEDGWAVAEELRPRIRRARGGDEHALRDLVARFLQTHGPVTLAYLEECWGVPLAGVLARLVEEGTVLVVEDDRFCDAENLERLLRLQRARRRPVFEALPLSRLPQFVARWQGVGGDTDLRETLERLFGFVAPAALWEEAILPARGAVAPGDLDLLLQESDLLWFGAGKARTGFCFEGDARLFLPPATESVPLVPPGRHDFFDLQRTSALDSRALTERLWESVWQGRVVNDTFAALRGGLTHGFRAAPTSRARRGFGRWQSSRPLVGTWRALVIEPAADELEEAEDAKDRARQLLARYGVLFRELCGNELPALAWGGLVRTLRLLELSGEVLAGRFFEGVDGLQFATPAAFRQLRAGFDDAATFLLNACDPASLCGTGLLDLPPRVPSTWLLYEGPRLVLVARRDGRDLDVRAPLRAEHLALLDGRSVTVETIDGATPAASPHARVLLEAGFRDDRGRLVREREF